MESGQRLRIKCSSLFIIATLAASSTLLLLAQPTRSMYMPHRRNYQSEYQPDMSLDSGEEDDMDQTASAPNRNRESNSERPSSDGYEENEPDGPYGETRRDEEGQADLERFFDDHLGASEREGMDKENLPSNIAPSILGEISPHSPAMEATRRRFRAGSVPVASGLTNDNYQILDSTTVRSYQEPKTDSGIVATTDNIESPTSDYLKIDPATPIGNVETKYIKLPNKRVIITRQVTPVKPMDSKKQRSATTDYQIGVGRSPTAPLPVGGDGVDKRLPPTPSSPARHQLVSSTGGESPSPSQASDVLATENDDYDQVYVTNKTNQPFKIEALGGYDPEEDFQDATRDIEEPTKFNSAPFEERQNDGKGKGGKKGKQEVLKDINFNDPESDNLFDAASETDEVTFNRDDPYQNDEDIDQLTNNQEPQRAHYDTQPHGAPISIRRVQEDSEPESSSGSDSSEGEPEGGIDHESTGNTIAAQDRAGRGGGDNDESDSNWVNDGVDDMEVPSQQHQDMVLEKAAKAEAEAQKRRDEAEAAAKAAREDRREDNDNEEEGQRMPNADYMKEDTDEIDKRR